MVPPGELADDVGDFHGLAVQGLGNALLEGDGDVSDLIGSLHGSLAQDEEMVIVGSHCGILELEAFMADVPQVAVAAVAAVCREGQVNAVCLAVCDLGFTGIHVPLGASPCSDNVEVGSQSLDAQLKTNLVVALTGRAVADRGCAFLAGNLNKLFGNQGTCHGGAKEIFVFVNGVSLYAGNDIFIGKLIGNIDDIELLGTAVLCALFKVVQFFFLSAVDADADDIKTIILFQPGNDRCCVKTAAVCQNDFFLCSSHDKNLLIVTCYEMK